MRLTAVLYPIWFIRTRDCFFEIFIYYSAYNQKQLHKINLLTFGKKHCYAMEIKT